MKKQKIHIEKVLNCRSANIIWPLMSTAAGLEKWIADTVEEEGDELKFTWGDVWKHHEIRMARIVEQERFDHIRFAWDDDPDASEYWELKIERSDLTGDYIPIITDFALEEDVDSIHDVWEANLEQLHHNTGL